MLNVGTMLKYRWLMNLLNDRSYHTDRRVAVEMTQMSTSLTRTSQSTC